MFSKHARVFAIIGLTAGSLGIGYRIIQTKDTLSNAVDPSILQLYEPQPHNQSTDKHYEPWLEPTYNKTWNFLNRSLNFLKFILARRLVNLALADNRNLRLQAVDHLSKLKLDKWQYYIIGHMCDARTAVGLARTLDVNENFFLPPPRKYGTYNNQMFLHTVKDYLNAIYQISQFPHPCIEKSISNIFSEAHDVSRFVDIDSYEDLRRLAKVSESSIPDCLESIKHHSLISKYSKDVLIKNGLSLLLEIYYRYTDDISVSMALCSIISTLSQYTELLEEIYQSGWISILAQWVNHPDIRLSAPASQALANLDVDDRTDIFTPSVFLLHPMYRSTEKVVVDVVFIHGLLGNVFYTWRTTEHKSLDIMGKSGGRYEEGIGLSKSENPPVKFVSDNEFMEELEEQIKSDWFSLGHDFEFVYYDSPESTNEAVKEPLTFKKTEIKDWNKPTQCWARDWLPIDCNNLRVLGVNYQTNISVWTHDCPELPKHVTLHERSKEIIESLKIAGVGQRPIIWITHSMGGLLAKDILVTAANSQNPEDKQLVSNSKAIFFYSTPHFGSKTATMNQAVSYFVAPTSEVTELRENSPALIQLHKDFLNLLQKNPINICSFIETKPTILSSMKFQLVSSESGNPGVGEVYEIPKNHLGICKPTNKESFLYQKVLKIVRNTVEEFYPTTS